MVRFLYLNNEEVVLDMALEWSVSSIQNCECNEHLMLLKIILLCPLAT